MSAPAWVRMRIIFGESVLPPESAAIVVRAVNRAVAVGDVSRSARWQFLEWMAVEYLHEQREAKAARAGADYDARPVVSTVSPVAAHDRLLALRQQGLEPNETYARATDVLLDVLDSLGYESATHQLALIRAGAHD